jgi:transcription initiation factor TFIIIB Brf1 subunit/transcription initiation factor TFIIB
LPIRACSECSSDRLVFPKAGQTAFTCDDCGWSGTPDEFPSWTAWQEFRLAAQASRPSVVATP